MFDVVDIAKRATGDHLDLRVAHLKGDTSDVLEKRRRFVAERLEEIRQRCADDEGVASGSGEQHGEATET